MDGEGTLAVPFPLESVYERPVPGEAVDGGVSYIYQTFAIPDESMGLVQLIVQVSLLIQPVAAMDGEIGDPGACTSGATGVIASASEHGDDVPAPLNALTR